MSRRGALILVIAAVAAMFALREIAVFLSYTLPLGQMQYGLAWIAATHGHWVVAAALITAALSFVYWRAARYGGAKESVGKT